MRASIEGFGRQDYKHASTESIARRAGMSKGLLFFYFRNKRALYLRTMDFVTDKMMEWVLDDRFHVIDDFFELMLYAGARELEFHAKWPWTLEFFVRAFYESHSDLRDSVARWMREQTDVLFVRFFVNVDFGRFRDDVDPRKVLDMLIMLADGYLHMRLSNHEPIDLDGLMDEFQLWCDILRAWAYKPEALTG